MGSFLFPQCFNIIKHFFYKKYKSLFSQIDATHVEVLGVGHNNKMILPPYILTYHVYNIFVGMSPLNIDSF